MTASKRFFATTLLLAGAGLVCYEAVAILRQRAALDVDRKKFTALQARVATARHQRDAVTPAAGSTSPATTTAPDRAEGSTTGDSAAQPSATAWAARLRQLKQLLAEQPGQQIPELKLLSDKDWLQVAQFAQLDTDEHIRAAFVELRVMAKEALANKVRLALRKFTDASGGELPADPLQLAPYCDPAVDTAMLARYAMPRTGKIGSDVNEMLVAEKSSLDDEHEGKISISLSGSQTETESFNFSSPAEAAAVQQATAEYTKAVGKSPESVAELRPYLPAATFETLLDFEQAATRFSREHNDAPPKDPEALRPYLKNPAKLDEMLEAAKAPPSK